MSWIIHMANTISRHPEWHVHIHLQTLCTINHIDSTYCTHLMNKAFFSISTQMHKTFFFLTVTDTSLSKPYVTSLAQKLKKHEVKSHSCLCDVCICLFAVLFLVTGTFVSNSRWLKIPFARTSEKENTENLLRETFCLFLWKPFVAVWLSSKDLTLLTTTQTYP